MRYLHDALVCALVSLPDWMLAIYIMTSVHLPGIWHNAWALWLT